uniref:DUF834 domain-containing protein n=1 Tax=Oryza punctata TaxID=4537 RepID=A0A0E0JZ57_ORYPU
MTWPELMMPCGHRAVALRPAFSSSSKPMSVMKIIASTKVSGHQRRREEGAATSKGILTTAGNLRLEHVNGGCTIGAGDDNRVELVVGSGHEDTHAPMVDDEDDDHFRFRGEIASPTSMIVMKILPMMRV